MLCGNPSRSVARLGAFLLALSLGLIAPLAHVAAQGSEDIGILDEGEYESPQFGYTVEWDDPWAPFEDLTVSNEDEGYDQLILDTDDARLNIFGSAAGQTTAEQFVESLIQVYEDQVEDFELFDSAASEETGRALVGYLSGSAAVYEYFEVRLIDRGDVLLKIGLVSPIDTFEDELDSARDVITLDGDELFLDAGDLELPESGDDPRDEPTEEPDEDDRRGDDDDVTPEPDDDDARSSGETEASPQYRGGPARTGLQPGPAPDGVPEEHWTYETGDTFGALSPAVDGDLVFFGPGELHAIERATGEEAGSFSGGDLGFVAPPAIDGDGTVYALNEGGTLFALRPADEETVWSYEVGGPVVGGTPTVSDGMVFFVANGVLIGLNAETGEEEWTADVGASYTAPAVVDGVVYVAGGSPASIYAFDAERGREQWSVEFGGGSSFGAFAVADETIFVANEDGTLYALSTDEGEELWSEELGNQFASGSPAVVDGVVFAAGEGSSFYALEAESGDEFWSIELDGDVSSQPVVVDSLVLVGDAEGTLYALDAETGDEEWTVDLGAAVEGSPVVIDGVIYADADGTVYALGEP